MKKITDQDIINACSNYTYMSEAYSSLKMNPSTFKTRAMKLGVYRSTRVDKPRKRYDLDDILKGLYPQYSSNNLKNRLFDENIKIAKCEKCGIENWNNENISFELHHIDGDNTNHILENLQILCPNCHSQTKTFKSKNIQNEKEERFCNDCGRVIYKKNKSGYCTKCVNKHNVKKRFKGKRLLTKTYSCKQCGKELERKRKRNLCSKCYHISLRKVERPSIEKLMEEVNEIGFSATGRKYGVSDNTIRKWLK